MTKGVERNERKRKHGTDRGNGAGTLRRKGR
uniref:Uncharacterized protein n=1 Tax=Caudovirales sp. ctCpR1 TaxID=2825760 RepID=A0A8S5V8Q0_9CAUD|nr:MAG TPA: hypothetical protein [Caudovirales sp. ctCpR1]DAJ59509.1 MAG TPA: hypothetical protein [Caudoviricetes sp.]